MDSDNILLDIIKWAWIALVGFIVHLYRKIIGLETREALLEQAQASFDQHRMELRQDLQRQHDEVMQRIARLEDLVSKRQ